jgi:hypothetical protein
MPPACTVASAFHATGGVKPFAIPGVERGAEGAVAIEAHAPRDIEDVPRPVANIQRLDDRHGTAIAMAPTAAAPR